MSVFGVALSVVPVVGSAFSELRSYQAREVMKARYDTLAQELRVQMQEVKEEVVNKDYVKSGAFFDLLRKAVETAERTRDEHNLLLVAQILKGAIVSTQQKKYSVGEHLYLISDLTPQELRVAYSLYEEQPEHSWGHGEEVEQAWEAWQKKVCDEVGIDRDDLRLLWDEFVPQA